jgi:cyanobactin maturation PatA/PatG family protease
MPQVTPNGLPFLEPYPPPQGEMPAGSLFPANPFDARQMVNYLAGFPTPRPPFPTQGGFPSLPHSPPPDAKPPATKPSPGPPYPESVAPFPPPLIEPPEGYRGYPAQLSEATELIWTLNVELTPIYAIRPAGNFSTEVYQRLVEFLAGQVRPSTDEHYVARISIPGVLTGETAQLFSGQVVPVVVPYLRGMYAWNERLLILQTLFAVGIDATTPLGQAYQSLMREFLKRIYYELRNLGQSSQERAMNYAATNTFSAASIFIDLYERQQQAAALAVASGAPSIGAMFPAIQSIAVDRSPFCRIDSDCWDVTIKFFYPNNVLFARTVYSYTIDVSDAYPVGIGELRNWSEPN